MTSTSVLGGVVSIYCFMLSVATISSGIVAFTSPSLFSHVNSRMTSLNANFLSNLFGGNQNANKSTVVFDIPMSNVKAGPIRFILNIHLVGLLNQPEKGTWFSKQDDEGGLDLYFCDGSAMVSLSFSEYTIKAERFGDKPSLRYLLQESIILHEVLDELNALAFDVGDIDEEKRLLQPKELDGIEKARSKLPAKAA